MTGKTMVVRHQNPRVVGKKRVLGELPHPKQKFYSIHKSPVRQRALHKAERGAIKRINNAQLHQKQAAKIAAQSTPVHQQPVLKQPFMAAGQSAVAPRLMGFGLALVFLAILANALNQMNPLKAQKKQ